MTKRTARQGRATALLLAVVAASMAVGAWLMVRGERPELAERTRRSGDAAGRESAPLPEPAASERAAAPARTVEPRADVASAAAGAPAASLLHGRVIVTDLDGSEHASESGELVATIPFVPPDTPPRDLAAVPIAAGAFELPMGTDALEVGWLVLRGRMAIVEPPQLVPDQDGNVVVHARWPPAAVLRVRDAATQRELDDVSILMLPDIVDRRPVEDCTPDQIIRAHAKSPIRLDSLPKRQLPYGWGVWWVVTAPGHASQFVQLDLRTCGERCVDLGPGAAIEATVRNWHPADATAERGPLVEPPPEPRLRIRAGREWDSDAKPDQVRQRLSRLELKEEFIPRSAGPFRVEGLEPGKVTVTVELGDRTAQPKLLAWVLADLIAGVTVPVVLDLAELPRAAPPAPLSGVVDLPVAWDLTSFSLEFRSAQQSFDAERLTLSSAQLEPEPGSASRRRFRIAAVSPGDYIVRVPGVETQCLVHQADGGSDDVLIQVPPPVTTTLVLRDARTREPVDGGQLQLVLEVRDIHEYRPLHCDFDPAVKGYPVRIAAGKVSISLDDWRYRCRSETIGLQRDTPTRDVEVEVEAACGVAARMSLGGTFLRGTEINGRIRLRSHDKRAGYHYFPDADRTHITVPGPGAYDLHVEAPDGCEPVPDRVIEIKEGEFLDVSIEFVRAR